MRYNQEIERRNLQQKATNTLHTYLDRREIAKNATKQFLHRFKRDNLNYLTQIGLLRSRFTHQLYQSLVPMLYTQVLDNFYGQHRDESEMV
jgi:hypothetical protein